MIVGQKMIIFHVLDDIVDNYNKTCHITINVDVKLVDVNLILMLNIMLILMKKILNFK